MGYYHHLTGVKPEAVTILAIKIMLVTLGIIIGVSAGFWVAVRTIPLPDETTVYQFERVQ